jgi:tRNA(fMet)-specific endonuclease VapC
MRFLIDTNILIFILIDKHHIDSNVKHLLSDYNNVFYVSSSSIFEALHLFQTGRIAPKQKTGDEFLNAIKTVYNLQILHTKTEHFDTFAKLPAVPGHNDPIDRIIIAQSITEKIPLISSDSKFKYYKNLDFIYNDKRAK